MPAPVHRRLKLALALVGGLAWHGAGLAAPVDELRTLERIGRALAMSPCAHPHSVNTQFVDSPRDKLAMDQIIRVDCTNLVSLQYLAHGQPMGNRLALGAKLAAPDKRLPAPVQVGVALRSVTDWLGKPRKTTANTVVYPLTQSHPDDDTLTFHLDKERVVAVQFDWFID